MSGYETVNAPKKGERDDYLTLEEQAFQRRYFSAVETIPEDFWGAVIQKVALNGEPIPYTQVQGLSRFAFGRGEGLPVDPSDGQFFTLSLENGVVWSFRYNQASEHAYKWEFVGGPPSYAAVQAATSTNSTTFVDLAGPEVTAPLLGDYLVTISARFTFGGGTSGVMSYSVGATAPTDDDAMQFSGDANNPTAASRIQVKEDVPAGSIIEAHYKNPGGVNNATFSGRLISIEPIRVA